jgi:hypothetical protein
MDECVESGFGQLKWTMQVLTIVIMARFVTGL